MYSGLVCLFLVPAWVENEAQPAKEEIPPTRLTISPAADVKPALKYVLLPEVRDRSPGNGALLYYRSFSPEWLTHLRPEVRKPLDAWSMDTKKKPPKELEWVLRDNSLKEVDLAARREYCDWEMTARLRKDGIGTLLPDVQSMRQYGLLLSLRARLQMEQGDWAGARHTFQTGLSLGRDVSNAPTLIHYLVGVAICQVMLSEIEEWMQRPGSPNLYWALTQLPTPMIDMRKSLQGERLMVDNLFPDVRDILAGTKDKRAAGKGEAFAHHLMKLRDEFRFSQAEWQARLEMSLYVARNYPSARAKLIELGWKEADVDALPLTVAVLMVEVYNYDLMYDEMLKWYGIPYWQARPHLMKSFRGEEDAFAVLQGRILARMLLPAVQKVYEAGVRLDRKIAAMRIVEAIRLYAAAHGGKLPESLADVKEVPIPLDPATGKEFVYELRGDKALITVAQPDVMPHSASYTIKYEITLRK